MKETNKFVLRAIKDNKDRFHTIRLEPKTLDGAIVGTKRINGRTHLVYSFAKLVNMYVNREGMRGEDAIEWIEYNTIRAIPYIRGPRRAEPIISEPRY